MRRHWTPAGLLERRTLSPAERALLDEARPDHTRLGMACLLKDFQVDWHFPRRRAEVPAAAIAHLAAQLGVPAAGFLRYDWDGRIATHHRATIRTFLRVRESTVADQQQVAEWLVAHVLPETQQPEVARAAFSATCSASGSCRGSRRSTCRSSTAPRPASPTPTRTCSRCSRAPSAGT